VKRGTGMLARETAADARRGPDRIAAGESHRPGWGAFITAGSALFVLLVGSNLPTPLFPLYAKVYGLSPFGVTLLFATYALLVIPALLIFGPLSDAKGRRELLIPAICLAGVAAGLFAAADDAAVLFAAQAVQAMALGALQGTAAPTLVENDPSGHRRRASAIASGLTAGGTAAGPLLAGLLAAYAVLPLRLAYLAEVGLLAIVLVAVIAKLPVKEQRERWRPRRPTVPAQIRRPFAVAATSAFVAWAVTGLFLSLIPSFVTTTLKGNLALAGAVVALMLGCSMVVQLAGYRIESLRAQTIGLTVMIAGLAALIAADITHILTWLLLATVLAGTGQGLAFMGSLGDTSEIAPQDRKADVVASYYVVIYIGVAVPVIGVGALTVITGLLTAVQIFAYVVIAICLAGLAALLTERRARRPGSHAS
jgi:MFS family permease